MKNIKGLLLFDYDGTLVDGTIGMPEMSEETKASLKKARENGYLTILSSGRNYPIVKDVAHHFDGFIMTNGAYAKIGDTEYFNAYMPVESVKALTEFCKPKADQLFATVETQEYTCGIDIGTKMYEYSMNYFNLDRSVFRQWEDDLETRYYKMLIMYEDPAIFDVVNERFKDEVEIIDHSTENYCEIMPKGITKGSAVKMIIEKCGIPKENVYAFGDSGNDYTMLKEAGHGIAMGKHRPVLDEVAEFVTKNVEDEGVSFALKHYGII